MHHLLSFVALLGLFAFPLSAFAQDLALKRVMLSSGGLGYFEYEATVNGDATLRLTVSLEQVDDERLDALGARRAEQLDLVARQVLEAQDARAQGVNGIPTFFFEKVRVVGCQPYEALARMAEQAGARRRLSS